MKKTLLIPVALFLLSACNNTATQNKADHQNDSLTSVIDERDSTLNDFIASFNEVESNLDSVATRQHIISLNTDKLHGSELKGNKKIRINAEIAAINNLMDKNRKELEDLKKRLNGSKYKNTLLDKTIKTMTIQISQKDYELCELNLQLVALKSRVEKLVTKVDSLDEVNYISSLVIGMQTTDLHTAYYIIGDKNDLKDKKVIDRKGGLLGIGRTSKLTDNFDNSMFTKIDYTTTTTIPVNGDDVKLITTHPSDSYTLDKDATKKDRINNITITNPAKFWSVSKYLVVVKK